MAEREGRSAGRGALAEATMRCGGADPDTPGTRSRAGAGGSAGARLREPPAAAARTRPVSVGEVPGGAGLAGSGAGAGGPAALEERDGPARVGGGTAAPPGGERWARRFRSRWFPARGLVFPPHFPLSLQVEGKLRHNNN